VPTVSARTPVRDAFDGKRLRSFQGVTSTFLPGALPGPLEGVGNLRDGIEKTGLQ